MEPVLIIAGIFLLSFLIQVFYNVRFFGKLAFFHENTVNLARAGEPVSIVICAKNESTNFLENLPSILQQSYPNYEVVVVNDGSWDKSLSILEDFEQQYPHLKIVNLVEQEKYPKGKKFALTLGIKAAKNEWLLFTDADCKPAGLTWLKEMQAHFTDRKDIVLGYSAYTKEPGFLNLFIRFETFMTGLFYLSFAIAGKPYMGVGRNLAYRRSLFFKVKGFASHNHILSGDDDLFVNETATNTNTAICISPESFTYSIPKNTIDGWLKQKSRHMSTGKHYKGSDQIRLAFYHLSAFLFYTSLISLLIMGFYPEILVLVYVLKLLIQFLYFYKSMKRLKDIQPVWFLPVMDFLYTAYISVFGVRSLFVKTRNWS